MGEVCVSLHIIYIYIAILNEIALYRVYLVLWGIRKLFYYVSVSLISHRLLEFFFMIHLFSLIDY